MSLFAYEEMYKKERLLALKQYKYCGVDKSPISNHILRHYWNYLVTYLPMSLAPNTVTLIGTGFMLLGALMALAYDHTFQKQPPAWMCFLFAALMWIYSTCDNLDGKQARRTNSSSPLGELFDHGCDAIVCLLGLLMKMSALALGRPDSLHIVKTALLLVTWCFFIPTWEEYHTGVLYLGYVNAPTEGILAFCALFIAAGLCSRDALLFQPVLFNWSFATVCLTAFLSFLFFFCIPSTVLNVKSSTQKTHWTQLVPISVCSLLVWNWWRNPLSICNSPRHLAAFVSLVGVISGKYATKIIHAHLLKERFPLLTRLMLPLLFGSLTYGSVSPFPALLNETTFLYSALILVLASYSFWTYHCVNSISQFLGIYCFSLAKRK